MYITNTGVPWVNQAWSVGSDEDMKTDMQDLDDTTMLALARGLKAKKYKRKGDPSGKWEIGFSAQDVQQIAPDMVHEVRTDLGDETMLAVRYNDLIPLLVKFAQRQDGRDDKQDNRMDALQDAVIKIAKKVGVTLP
jgi:hypothetical protein